MDIMQKLKDNTGILSLLLIFISLILLPLTALDIFTSSTNPTIEAFRNAVGDWDKWIFMISLLCLIIGLIYFVLYTRNQRSFFSLIDTTSKQTFIKNQEDIEYYAWKLGSQYEKIVKDKKIELGITKTKKGRKKDREK